MEASARARHYCRSKMKQQKWRQKPSQLSYKPLNFYTAKNDQTTLLHNRAAGYPLSLSRAGSIAFLQTTPPKRKSHTKKGWFETLFPPKGRIKFLLLLLLMFFSTVLLLLLLVN